MSSTTRQLHMDLVALSTVVAIGCIFYLKQERNRQENNVKSKSIDNNNSIEKYVVPTALNKCPLARELEVAVELALKAGRNMYRYCDEKGTLAELKHDLGISEKGGQAENFCTAIDIENETSITAGILNAFPDHHIIGEESTGTDQVPALNEQVPTWVIDPIDGTTNFAAGLPLTCVSIGLCVKGKPVLGVVYAPMTDELYMAVTGYGAYRNGIQLLTAAAKQHQQQKSLKDAIVCFELGYARNKESRDKELAALQRIMENGYRSLKSLGSGVLDLCYVATGRLDAVYAGLNEASQWKPWDYCAGLVIVNEVGCVIESIDQAPGKEFHIYADSVICAVNKSLLNEIRHCIKG